MNISKSNVLIRDRKKVSKLQILYLTILSGYVYLNVKKGLIKLYIIQEYSFFFLIKKVYII